MAPLPPTPTLEWLLYEQPWPLAAGLAALGVGGLILLARAARPRLGMGVLATGLGLAAGAVLLARGVTTAREVVRERTRELIAAAVAVDLPALGGLLAEDASAVYFAAPSGIPRDALLRRVEEALGRTYRVRAHRVVRLSASHDAPRLARTLVNLSLEDEGTRLRNASWWRITWRLDDDGAWRAVLIEGLRIAGIDGP